MIGYILRSVGAPDSNILGGTLAPGQPAGFQAGDLILLKTGVNTISLPTPTITGYTLLSTTSNQNTEVLFGRIAQPGDTAPTVTWDASHQSYAVIAGFTGSVYTDLSTIVDKGSDRVSTGGASIGINGIAPPSTANCLIIRGGHCTKTALNNSGTFGDWVNDSGIFVKIGSDIVQSGNAIASAWWYLQQSGPVGYGLDSSLMTVVESGQNTQGFVVALKSAAPVPPQPALAKPRQVFVDESTVLT